MSKKERGWHLKNLHENRKIETQMKVDKAISNLIRSNKLINFNSIHLESGLSKTTLYNNKEIRERIEALKHQQLSVPTPGEVKREMNENSKDALIAILKRKVKKLEEENKKLKDQLKINMADIYKNI